MDSTEPTEKPLPRTIDPAALVKKNTRLFLKDWLYLKRRWPNRKPTQVIREVLHDFCNQERRKEAVLKKKGAL